MIPLTLIKDGKKQIIKSVIGRDDNVNKLANLGCVAGEEITVISSGGDTIMVMFKNSRIAIDKQLASKIMV